MGSEKELIIDLKNRIAIVTGGSRGLGKNSAFRPAEKGSDVIITYYQQAETADYVVKEIEKRYQRTATALQLDVGDIDSFELFFVKVSERLDNKWDTNKFDFLVNNAGMARK